MRLGIAATCIVLILANAAQAAEGSRLLSPSLQTTGIATLKADLTVLDLRGAEALSQASLSLVATHVHTETDNATGITVKIGTDQPVAFQDPQPTLVQDYGPMQASAMPSGNEPGLFIAGSPGAPPPLLTVSATDARMDALAFNCHQQPYYAMHGTGACPYIGHSISATLQGVQGGFSIEGSFYVALWGWSGTFADAARQDDFWSGQRFGAETITGVPGLTAGNYTVHLVHIFVDNGRLDVAGVPALQAFAPRLGLQSPQAVRLGGGPAATVDGQPDLDVVRDGELLSIGVRNGLPMGPDARPFALAPAPAPEASPAAWWASAAAGAAVLLVAGVALRRRAGREHIRYAVLNLEAGNHNAAMRHAEAAMAHRSARPHAGVLGTIALLRAGDLPEAETFLSRFAGSGAAPPAAVHYLRACLRSLQGRRAEAQVALADCLREDPAYLAEARANPLLARLAPGFDGAGGYA